MSNKYYEFIGEIPINTVRNWSSTVIQDMDWKFFGWSGEAKEPYRHWCSYPKMEFHKTIRDIWDCIEPSFAEEGLNLEPERVIANLFNHGDSSWLHQDTTTLGYWTVIIYLNDHWDLNWGGETVLVEDNEILKAFAPTPGKYVAFRSDLLHGPRPVSREAPYPRFGLTFQCKANDHNLQKLQKPEVSSVHTPL